MSDDPFAAFKEGQPPAEGGQAPKEKKKRKIPPKKGATNGTAPAKEATTPKKERKAHKPRAVKEMRLPISTLLEIGSLTSEESAALLSIGVGLQKLGKKSRGRIVQALGKVFG